MSKLNKTKRTYLRTIYNQLNDYWLFQKFLEHHMETIGCKYNSDIVYDGDNIVEDERYLVWDQYKDNAFMIACFEEEVARINHNERRYWNRKMKETRKKLEIDDNLFEYILRCYEYPA